ncbi:MAG: DUF255 domain-containing protein [Planctomycetaceae bacterium]|nr:DUF255 domain-containing protein [Planctomycetaceae bacterium]
MRVIRSSVLLFLLVLGLGSAARSAEVNWQPADLQAAMTRAGAEGKLIYIFVEGSNCPPCESFKLHHLHDPIYADFINTLFVPIRCHEGNMDDRAFLESLRLVHAAVPRFYVLAPDARGVSMSIGTVNAAPTGAVDVLKMAVGKPLPVNQQAAQQLAMRIRNYAATQRAAGALYDDGSGRNAGIPALEAWAWALGGNLDEAERAWGGEWSTRLHDQELRYMYVSFWSKWGRNAAGALQAAQDYRQSSPGDQAGEYLMGMALAANGRYEEAMRIGESLMMANPDNTAIQREVESWRNRAGMSSGMMLNRR